MPHLQVLGSGAKGIDVVQSPNDEIYGPYVVEDLIWMKSPGSRCTIRFKRGRVTGVVSQQSVLVDGIPRHVRDLRPALEMGHSATDESDESSGDELLMDCTSCLPKNVTTNSSDDSEAETVVHVPFRRSTQIKRSSPHPALCVIKRSVWSVEAIMLTHEEKG